MTDVVAVRQLCKTYKGGVKALDGLDLEVKKGDLFGLVGPDGAGKSTALKILAGVLKASSGEALVFGRPASAARALVGFVPQNCALYPELTVDESLAYEAGLHNVDTDVFQRLRLKHLERMGLARFGDRLTSKLSGGMRQNLALCCALVSQPQLILLDEPTTGLDPIARRELWQTLVALAEDGVTTIIATPFLDEAERCSRIALMYQGKIHQSGSPEELQTALALRRLEITLPNSSSEESRGVKIGELSEKIVLSENIVDVYPFGDHLEVLAKDAAMALNQIENFNGGGQLTCHESTPTMENVFVLRLRELGLRELTPPQFPVVRSPAVKSPAVNLSEQQTADSAISAQNLVKRYGDFTAVDGLNLDIKYGEIYGLLGANGAGKTTTIKMLCGLLAPTSGQVCLAGESTSLRSRELRRKIGYMSQKFTLYDGLTVAENLEFYSAIYELPRARRKQQLDWALAACGLDHMANSLVGSLPLGWKQRIAFGAAVMHDPEVIFLDEPTAGVDPLARRQIWSSIRDFAKRGAAILVTTHYLDEAEYCNRLSFVSASKMVAEGTPTEVKSDHDGELFELVCQDASQSQKAFSALATELEPWRISVFGKALHVLLDHAQSDMPKVKALLATAGLPDVELRAIKFSLEDAFIAKVQSVNNHAGGLR
ncbi:ABC transporter ATP-binding protein [bacterium]|jgi:ABC-2 type transport system ATP-binding protein|nr:ABC transporter ATP-binding protein [bacterium]